MLVTAASRLAATGNRLTRMLDYTGRHTMAIMLWHIPAFKLVILFQMWVCDYPPRYLAWPPGHPHRVALVVDTLHRGRNHPAAGLLPAVRPAHTIRPDGNVGILTQQVDIAVFIRIPLGRMTRVAR